MFAVSSDDNSEFWLSTDDSPRNVEVLALVGKVCGGHIQCPLTELGMSIAVFQSNLLIFVRPCALSRLGQSGRPWASLPSLPVRPPDQFGEATSEE